jgi:putative tricarboxylic transport membrane protein
LLDLASLYLVGVLGCAMRIYGVPLVPAVLGLVLGPLSELQFRRAMAISEGDLSVFVTRPISAALLLVAAMLLFGSRLVTKKLTQA